ncbi:hypothetical protein ACSQ67_012051 [Phaseolus vulgaris]
MVKKNKIRKEDIAEDWCFVCKDGGLLMVCDHRDCRKTYHPRCVDKDDSFSENGSKWTCSSHFCFLCHKASKFKCFCCPKAICEKCIYDAEFVTVKGNKGFCSHCSKLAFLIEDDADNDSDGDLVDFKDQDTYEFLFSEYYEFIKEEDGLNSEHVHSAHRFFKNGKRKRDLDPDEMGLGVDGSGDSEDMSNYIVSDCEDLNYTAGSMSERTKKGLGKLKSMKGNEKDKKKSLLDGVQEYCRENDLFDPKKKRKIHCDAPLRSLLGRKSVNRNSMQNLLAQHFAENFEEMGDISSSSEDRDYNEPSTFSRKRKSISCTKSHNLNLVCEEHQSCFAAIVSSNLKLVYLKRSLVDELSKQPQTFDDKVLGSYVRIKTDPYDYLQKNSHLLVQVVGVQYPVIEGINISLRNDEFNKEIMLQLSYVPKHVPISKISDDDFSEEECQDLYQRMRNGLLKQPTVLELEQKARSLHEDIMKHWISRKLVLLQNRIDHANEKGWRREYPFMIYDQKLKLETQLEQSRLLNDIPKVIPEIVDTTLSQEGSPRIDKVEQNGLSELASGQTSNSVGHYSKHSGFAHSLNNRTDVAGKMVRSRGRDDSIIRHGHVQHGVSTSLHGHLAIELGNIPYSNVQPGTTAFVDDHQSVPHSSAPSSSNHTSVPRTVGGENVVQCPTYGHSWGLAVQPIVAPSVHTVLAPSVHTNPAPQVQTTSAPPNSQLRHQILEATERANQANQRTAELKETVRLMQQQLAMMMERYVADTPIDTSEVHPHRRL